MARCLQSLDPSLILGEFSGEAAAVYPRFKRLGSAKDIFRATTPYALVGLELSSSIVAFGGRGSVMVVIGKQDDYLTLSKAMNVPIIHLTDTNSIVGPPQIVIPTSKVTPLSFGAFGLSIPAGTPIALYGSLDATDDNFLFAACSLQLIEVRASGTG